MTLNFQKNEIATIIISVLHMSIINYFIQIYYKIYNSYCYYTFHGWNVKIKYKFLVISKWNYNITQCILDLQNLICDLELIERKNYLKRK